MDLANEIQFREVITNIDLLEKILEKSFLSDAEEVEKKKRGDSE